MNKEKQSSISTPLLSFLRGWKHLNNNRKSWSAIRRQGLNQIGWPTLLTFSFKAPPIWAQSSVQCSSWSDATWNHSQHWRFRRQWGAKQCSGYHEKEEWNNNTTDTTAATYILAQDRDSSFRWWSIAVSYIYESLWKWCWKQVRQL